MSSFRRGKRRRLCNTGQHARQRKEKRMTRIGRSTSLLPSKERALLCHCKRCPICLVDTRTLMQTRFGTTASVSRRPSALKTHHNQKRRRSKTANLNGGTTRSNVLATICTTWKSKSSHPMNCVTRESERDLDKKLTNKPQKPTMRNTQQHIMRKGRLRTVENTAKQTSVSSIMKMFASGLRRRAYTKLCVKK